MHSFLGEFLNIENLESISILCIHIFLFHVYNMKDAMYACIDELISEEMRSFPPAMIQMRQGGFSTKFS